MSGGYLTMQGKDGIRIWVHDNWYRIQQFKTIQVDDKSLEYWESYREDDQVKMFETWQLAEQYIRDNNII